MTCDVFLTGALCHAPLLLIVLGRDPAVEPAFLSGHSVCVAQGRNESALVKAPGCEAEGVLLRCLSDEDVARLNFYLANPEVDTQQHSVRTSAGGAKALILESRADSGQVSGMWSLQDWLLRRSAMVMATAGDVMALYGQSTGESVRARHAAMLVRGAGRVRALDTAPNACRRVAAPSDVEIVSRRQPYADFFAVEAYDLRFRRFDGGMSPQINRAAFVSGDAVTVLPYDPVRDRVLLIEQFRMGPFARGDSQPWMLEAIAGRIDAGESPQQAARREAVEEAGLSLGDLLHVAGYYPSPAVKTEFLYSYVALCDLPDGVAGVFGEVDEAEDIRGHLISFEAFMDLVSSGEIAVGPLVITALWLQRERARLRGLRAPPAAIDGDSGGRI